MAANREEIVEVVFQALSHPMRRNVLAILGADPKGVSYTELIGEMGLPTGKLNYHLDQLGGLIEKNAERRYVLTPLGKKALSQVRLIEQEVSGEDEKYVRIAEKAQRATLEPTVRALLLIAIAGMIVGLFAIGFLMYIALTEGGLPLPLFAFFPLFAAFDIAIVITLVRALQRAPAWLRRLEHRFLAA